MRNVTTALVSFSLGAISMFLLGNQTSTFAQFPDSGKPIANSPAIPVIPPFLSGEFARNRVTGSKYGLDGVRCTDCILEDVTLEYGGGAFDLRGLTLKQPIRLNLVGAAANTAQLMAFFGLVGCPQTPMPQPPNNAPTMNAKFIPTGQVNLRSFTLPAK